MPLAFQWTPAVTQTTALGDGLQRSNFKYSFKFTGRCGVSNSVPFLVHFFWSIFLMKVEYWMLKYYTNLSKNELFGSQASQGSQTLLTEPKLVVTLALASRRDKNHNMKVR